MDLGTVATSIPRNTKTMISPQAVPKFPSPPPAQRQTELLLAPGLRRCLTTPLALDPGSPAVRRVGCHDGLVLDPAGNAPARYPGSSAGREGDLLVTGTRVAAEAQTA